MSRKFKSQDYFRYPKLGKKWRRPVGHQSKLRKGKGGSGMVVSIGYGTPAAERHKIGGAEITLVRNAAEVAKVTGAAVIASGVGKKKVLQIYERARENNVRILNMKKVRSARKTERRIREGVKEKAEKKESAKAESKEESAKTVQKDTEKEAKSEA